MHLSHPSWEWILAAVLRNLSVFQLKRCNFLTRLRAIRIKFHSCTFRAAIRTFHGSPRPACDNVRVNLSAAAPGRDDVILICDSDCQHMASVTHTHLLTCFIQLALSGGSSVPSLLLSLSPSMCQSKPC